MGTLSMMIVLAMTLAPRQVQVQKGGDNPIYKITINVVEREATAINYQHRSGSTTIDFKGTPLLPEARGEAGVEPIGGADREPGDDRLDCERKFVARRGRDYRRGLADRVARRAGERPAVAPGRTISAVIAFAHGWS